MIDKATLDAVLPLPELEECRDEVVTELKEEDFVVTNFHSGGIFYTLLMIVLRIEREFKIFLRGFLNNAFVTHASGAWLDLKAGDYSKKRKRAQKAQGLVTVSRINPEEDAVKIEKGHVFKTQKDINGEELRFFVIEARVLQKGARAVDVLVEAEIEGSRYNVPEGQITRSLTFLNGVDTITNGADWITREGSDTEDDDGLRTRSLRSWSELAARPIADTFINAAEGVPGVLFAQADCQHPRGQGTVDVIVTGTAGEATEGLLDAVREAVDKIAGPYDSQADWLPDKLPALYTPVRLTAAGYPVWNPPTGAHDAYNAGDVVDYHGTLYRCTIDGNIWSPKDLPTGMGDFIKRAGRDGKTAPPESLKTCSFVRAAPPALEGR